MNILPSAIVVAAILTSPVYAAAPRADRAVASVKRPPNVDVVTRKGVFLEHRPVEIDKANRNAPQDLYIEHWLEGYPREHP
jgi:hypothetical protein